jgi:hypothetical protein
LTIQTSANYHRQPLNRLFMALATASGYSLIILWRVPGASLQAALIVPMVWSWKRTPENQELKIKGVSFRICPFLLAYVYLLANNRHVLGLCWWLKLAPWSTRWRVGRWVVRVDCLQSSATDRQFFMGNYFGFTATNNRFLVRDCVLKNHG